MSERLVEGYEKCTLCRNARSIKNSHVIPAFVFRWMRKTGGTGFLRFAGAPNRRVQDGLKLPLLCSGCEASIGQFENSFARRFFIPSAEGKKFPQKTGRRDFLFLCSLHFRVLVYLTKNSDYADFYSKAEKRLILRSIRELREILRGKRQQSSTAKHYLQPIGTGKIDDHLGLPTNWNRFVRRQTELDLFASDNGKILGSYVKFGPWVSVYPIKNDSQPWVGGQILPIASKPFARNTVWPNFFFEYLISRANAAQKALGKLSDRQLAVIDDALQRADFAVEGKQMFEALDADFKAFGLRAFRPASQKGGKRRS